MVLAPPQVRLPPEVGQFRRGVLLPLWAHLLQMFLLLLDRHLREVSQANLQ